MVAVATHQVAVYLYKLDLNLGGHQDYATWEVPKDDIVFYQYHPDGKLPSLFFHKQYRDYDQYPEGAADMREAHEDPNAVFLHSFSENVTYRIWQLLDTQKKALLEFLQSEDDVDEQTTYSHGNLLPMLPDKTNLTRIDPEEPITRTGIYRDLWERKPLGDSDGDRRLGCVAYNDMDYPTFADYEKALERAQNRRYRILDRREEEVKAEIEAEALAEQQEDEDEGEMARVLKTGK
ncbi:hypothetical protein KVR01_009549 [Diaporthe batatas]|uniref:uncharacterized protein n=1 Tax=Diaporthe batatas TaxID=748121 RepID=UPI001D052603|nr:uncharacterized protein KVR01_009549 [Diaporthe batatas]KAG8161285.1 hypothetical protein KVR01_009549 [Diaporthe batatas]